MTGCVINVKRHYLANRSGERHNAEVTGAGAQRREPKAVRFWRPVDRLVNGRSPPRLSLESKAACPLPDNLHQLNGCDRDQNAKAADPITI